MGLSREEFHYSIMVFEVMEMAMAMAMAMVMATVMAMLMVKHTPAIMLAMISHNLGLKISGI